MSTIKNAQISLYCHFNRIIKEPGTSFQSSALSQKHDDVTDFEICEFHTQKKSGFRKNETSLFLYIKNSLIRHQELLYFKNSFLAEATFKPFH